MSFYVIYSAVLENHSVQNSRGGSISNSRSISKTIFYVNPNMLILKSINHCNCHVTRMHRFISVFLIFVLQDGLPIFQREVTIG